MKKYIVFIIGLAALMQLSSCVDLDLNPLSEGASETWYSSQEEIEMSVCDFYRDDFFPIFDPLWGLDLVNRSNPSAPQKGEIVSTTGVIKTYWANYYKGIARAFRLLNKIDNARKAGVAEATITQYEGEAYFYIGFAYGMLAFYWGDVILDKTGMTLDEFYDAVRSPKADVLAFSYECLDKAAEKLPLNYSGVQRATKGAAYGMKARIALFNGDWKIASDAAKNCMDLGQYELFDNYEELFKTDWNKEGVFTFVGDYTLGETYYVAKDGRNYASRTAGGLGSRYPSQELVCLYTCTDGLPIDESPLYNPKSLFDNRDPRLSMTVVPFATPYTPSVVAGTYKPEDYDWLGYEHSPNPSKCTVTRFSDGKQVSNADSKSRGEHASYNGFLLKKYINPAWQPNRWYGGGPFYYLRYADVLLMYAEAMNEQGLCDQTVLDLTINPIRERAYRGTGITYPKALASTQAAMRKMIRIERQTELAVEGRSYDDMLRWRCAEIYFNRPIYYLDRSWSGKTTWNGDLSQVSDTFKQMIQNWNDGNYPIGGTPQIDENGIADIGYMLDAKYVVVAAKRSFDKDRDYLWPIPQDDIDVNDKLTQNPGY